ncbi:trypsin-like serine peptidase [Roseateles violae]|uniref:Serine protease n=1 Tax=Roseateles violae TaxID=3058042 RepID=A0ABT8DWH8_9BURK|nr:serine protease [Pelomonas sp. PFR6]MDN3922523.1 serine protease [Pelomonas sp. PFR6]
MLTSFGYASNDGIVVEPGIMSTRDYRDGALKVRYVRFLINVKNTNGARWQLIVRDADLRPVESITSAAVPPNGSLWTRRIYTEGMVTFHFTSSDPNSRLEIPTTVVMPEDSKRPYYSIQTQPAKFMDLYKEASSEKRIAGDHIGMLSAIWGSASWCCSAVAVTEDLVLTNWHCGGNEKILGNESGVWSQAICDRTIIDFSWDQDGTDREFACMEVVDMDPAADFALLRVAPIHRLDTLRPAKLRSQGPGVGEELRLIHHPACRPKNVTDGCRVGAVNVRSWRGALSSDFQYPCDSENGSSGAPLLDKNDQVVGIHHLGFEKMEDGTCDRLNKGVALPAILGAMKPTIADRIRKNNPLR